MLVILSPLAARDRILEAVDVNRTVPLKGQVHPLARPQSDAGPVDPALQIGYVTLLLKPDASLESFLAELQTPSAPAYHRWITPEQFAGRFGLSSSDIAKLRGWLESQGLIVNDVARGRHWITFSGTAERIGRALHTGIHRYLANGELRFANNSDLSIPEAFQDVVAGFRGLNNFPGHSPLVRPPDVPEYTIGFTHYLAPDDFATIYDVAPLYKAGIDGTGQTLVIVGESAIELSDIRTFRIRFNLPPNDPQLVLFGSDPGIVSGWMTEADLDLELSGAIARNAKIIFAYSTDLLVAMQYAIDQNLGSVVSASYSSCEPYDSPAFRAVAQQANAQGITIFAASGDWGAATCDFDDPTPQVTTGLSVSLPASMPEVTAVGGTEFRTGPGNYWASSNNLNGASALSYIPEVPWNDASATNSIEAGGGGASVLFSKPSWQTGPGVPNDGARDVPDVSLMASPLSSAYLIQSAGRLIPVGGTSASSPAFAGIAALLNQYLNSTGMAAQPGLGNINPALYRLAQSSTGVFHDIASGDNKLSCAQSSPDCIDGLIGFSAAPGYDLATGLGSVDVYNLVMEWNSGTSSTTTVTASPATAGLSDTIQLTATVSAGAGSAATPQGSVTFIANDMSVGTAGLVAAANGSATVSVSASGNQIALGSGTVTAVYSGDAVFTGSEGSTAVTIQIPSTGGSVVIPWVTPTPVVTHGGNIWPYTIGLTEKAGVATTLTGLTVNGAKESLSEFASTALPPFGTISADEFGFGLTNASNPVFVFTGVDASGQTWSQQLIIPFAGLPAGVREPAMSLTTETPVVLQNPQADPSCQWSQQLTIQEQGGYLMLLTKLTVNGADISPQIPQIFGTTRLAPLGMLRGNLCFSSIGVGSTKIFQLLGTTDSGDLANSIATTLSTSWQAAATTPNLLSASPQSVTLSASDSSGSATASVNIGFSGGAAQWTVSISPANQASSWLTVSPLSGQGAAQLTIQASAAGLSPGAYNAVVAIQAPNCVPQAIEVPVTFIVGASGSTSIAGLGNNFSGATTVAPGTMVAVYGSDLAPAATFQLASLLPLFFDVTGVSATVNGVSAPLYFVSPGQIDLQIPYETGAGTAILAVNNNGQIASFSFPVAATAPGLYNSAIDNTTGKIVSTAQPGQVLLLYMTGEGDVTPTLATGATPVPIADPSKYPQPRAPVSVTVGGIPAQVLFQGIPSGLVAETQIDFIVPQNAPLGPQQVIVTVGSVSSPPIALTIAAPVGTNGT